jgi:hypothetical protein
MRKLIPILSIIGMLLSATTVFATTTFIWDMSGSGSFNVVTGTAHVNDVFTGSAGSIQAHEDVTVSNTCSYSWVECTTINRDANFQNGWVVSNTNYQGYTYWLADVNVGAGVGTSGLGTFNQNANWGYYKSPITGSMTANGPFNMGYGIQDNRGEDSGSSDFGFNFGTMGDGSGSLNYNIEIQTDHNGEDYGKANTQVSNTGSGSFSESGYGYNYMEFNGFVFPSGGFASFNGNYNSGFSGTPSWYGK